MIDGFSFKALNLLAYAAQTQTAFDWGQGMLVLAVTAIVLAGLAMVEAVHRPRQRAPKPVQPPSVKTPKTRKTSKPIDAEAAPAPQVAAQPTPQPRTTAPSQVESEYFQGLPWTERVAWGRGALAGLLGTAVMTAFFAIAAGMGAPRLEPPAMLASLMANSMLLGWIAHFVVGVVLADIYAMWFTNALPGPTWVRGAIYGLLPFFIVQMIMSPLMGGGFFSSTADQAIMVVLMSLAGHVIYGAVVGGVYGNPISADEF